MNQIIENMCQKCKNLYKVLIISKLQRKACKNRVKIV